MKLSGVLHPPLLHLVQYGGDKALSRLAIINFHHQNPSNKFTLHKFHFRYRRLGLANKRVGVAKSSQTETVKIKQLIVKVFYRKVALK